VSRRAGFLGAAIVAAILVAGATLLRVGAEESTTPLSYRLLPILVATALLLAALLAVPRSAAVAWAFVTLSSGLSAFEVVAVVRRLEPEAVSDGRQLTLIAAVAIVSAVGVAGAFAARARAFDVRRARVALAVVGLGAVVTTGAAIWAIVAPIADDAGLDPGLTPLRVAARVALVTWAAALLVGVVRDVGPAAIRAAARMGDGDPNPARSGLFGYLRLFADELMPGRSKDRRELVEAERARLAADLHALVLPDLRRAASTAKSGGASEAMQVDLRRALEDVEQLMLQRQSIVLEQFGLVAALEWLAERTEERSPLRVDLELEGELPADPQAVDSAIARAAFRIALLALDNVTRHADATTATVRLATEGRRLKLEVADDGHGGGVASATGRGLADMRSEASGSGGTLEIHAAPGVRIEANWPLDSIAGKPATRPAGLTDRSGAQAP
jgi:signal transduction histidine kinase